MPSALSLVPLLPCSYALGTTDAGDSLPHPQALHPTLPGPDRFRQGALAADAGPRLAHACQRCLLHACSAPSLPGFHEPWSACMPVTCLNPTPYWVQGGRERAQRLHGASHGPQPVRFILVGCCAACALALPPPPPPPPPPPLPTIHTRIHRGAAGMPAASHGCRHGDSVGRRWPQCSLRAAAFLG